MQAELISCLGTDLTVVNAARVSFDKESDWEVNHSVRKELSSKDAALIRYLAKHNHFTPFTHCMITLRETIPIFVARDGMLTILQSFTLQIRGEVKQTMPSKVVVRKR